MISWYFQNIVDIRESAGLVTSYTMPSLLVLEEQWGMSLQVVLSIFFILKNDNKSQDNFWCDILARNACHIIRKAMAVWLKGHLPNREENTFTI